MQNNSINTRGSQPLAEISGRPGIAWGNVIVPASGRSKIKIKVLGDMLQTNIDLAYGLEKKEIITPIVDVKSVEISEGRLWWLLGLGFTTLFLYFIGVIFIILFFVIKQRWIKHIIVSLDYAKAERRRASFITHCPDLVIVDEAHTCAHGNNKSSSQQQRHQLIQEIAQKQERHLLLLTATPHSGIEAAFLSLLGLLKPEFENLTLDKLTEEQRDKAREPFYSKAPRGCEIVVGERNAFPRTRIK